MRKSFTLQGLGCANCAAKIEREVSGITGVSEASLNFSTSVLQFNITEELAGNITELIETAVHKYESEVTVTDNDAYTRAHSHDHDHTHEEGGKSQIIRLAIGAAVFGAGMLADRFITGIPYLSLGVLIVSYLLLGGDVLIKAARNIIRGQIFDENFLMTIASIGAFAIGEYPEAAAVMLFYQIGEMCQDMAVRKSKKSIADLMDIRPDYANLQTGTNIIRVAPESVNIGDIIIVKPGEKIPLDGVVTAGESMLDTTALTGESVPRKVSAGVSVLSGCINQSGLLTIRVTETFGESTVAKILNLVESAGSKKAHTENFITVFSRYYTPVVVIFAALMAVVPPLLMGGAWTDWINRGLIFLVISCPCALVISIPLSFFGGIGGASRKGILVKGGNYLEALSKVDTVVFDKTGTLTYGVFKVVNLIPANGKSEDELIELAAYAESFSNHPIAKSILSGYGKPVEGADLSGYEEISGHGVSVKSGADVILAGNRKLMEREGIAFEATGADGTVIYVALNGVYAGSIVIADEIKPDSKYAIFALKDKGIRKTVMLTGDNPQIAETVGDELGIDAVYGGLLPADKVAKVEELLTQTSGKLAFVGDGINDAPVLTRADVGIAMGGLGSDAAIEAADVVIMTDEPSKLAEAIEISRFTKRIVWQNIIFALGVKGAFLLLGAFGIATMWEAVFADVGVALLAVLNAARVMRRS
ncbi:MAG: cadmium-translocating P-type ATPase [Oscillospiraceae bacterium]|jgi:Cd2+/Zn2+-exporting ATPase|nr:cadmium-translocating P-type ATPase [Oscillospiraceae bacterium]